jgi:hypothetical protein
MSDNYAIKRYHRQTVSVVGSNRKKKYLVLVLLLLVAGVLGMGWLVYSSGIMEAENPRLAPDLANRINLERQAHDLPPVQGDASLSYLAYTKSQEVKVAQLNYGQGGNANLDATTDVIIIPKMTWAFSGKDFRQQLADTPENAQSTFRNHVLDPAYRTIGIGVSSDSYNYYIVTKWK